MIPLWWSLLLAAVGVAGLWIAGTGRAAGWAVGLAAQALWIAYALATGQWGFILSAGAYAIVYGRNLVRWRSGDWYARASLRWQRTRRSVLTRFGSRDTFRR